MQTVQDLLRDMKQAKKIFGFVAYNQDDGTYFEMKKTDVQFVFKDYPRDTPVSYRIDIAHKAIYLN